MWQQSRMSNDILKAEVRKTWEVVLDDSLGLVQIDEGKDPNYFTTCGVKCGIARRFVKLIRFWAENIIVETARRKL